MFYITPLTANELLNKKTLWQKESKCGVLYRQSADYWTPGLLYRSWICSHNLSFPIYPFPLLSLSFQERSPIPSWWSGNTVWVAAYDLQVRLLAMGGFFIRSSLPQGMKTDAAIYEAGSSIGRAINLLRCMTSLTAIFFICCLFKSDPASTPRRLQQIYV